jgi:hypothetical protein
MRAAISLDPKICLHMVMRVYLLPRASTHRQVPGYSFIGEAIARKRLTGIMKRGRTRKLYRGHSTDFGSIDRRCENKILLLGAI